MLTFVRQVLRDRCHTGAVLPSSPHLARAMTRAARIHPGPKRILEVGPGTGPFTRQLLRCLGPGDELHIIEISAEFSRLLKKRLLDPYLKRHPNRTVHLHCHPIEEAPIEGKFDLIVCGLPFNNFPPALVRRIFRIMIEHLAPGGELTYFEYAGVRAMKGPLVGDRGRRKLRQIDFTGRVLRKRLGGRRKLVLANLPPAMMVRLVMPMETSIHPNVTTSTQREREIETKDAPLGATPSPR